MKRIGLVGTGLMGQWHLERWQRLPVEIAGCYDLNQEAAQRAADRFGGKAFESIEAMLDSVDIVDVCTHTPAHKAPVLAAAAAGKDIVCEKPLGRHVVDCEEMVAACEASGARLFVAQVVRFFPQFAQAKAVLDSGQLGTPGVIRTIRGGSFPRSQSNTWYNDLAASGGVIMDVSIHDIDFVRWCFGEVKRVFARGLTFANEDRRDHALIVLRFENGAVGHIEGSWAFPPGRFQTRLEITGDQGILEWDSTENEPFHSAILTEGDDAPVSRRSLSPISPDDDPYFVELKHFLTCLESGEPFRVTAHDGLMAVKVSLAAIESMRTGKPIDIANFEEASA